MREMIMVLRIPNIPMTEEVTLAIHQIGLDAYVYGTQKTANVCVQPISLVSLLMMGQTGSGNDTIFKVCGGVTEVKVWEFNILMCRLYQWLMKGRIVSADQALLIGASDPSLLVGRFVFHLHHLCRAPIFKHREEEEEEEEEALREDPTTFLHTVNQWFSEQTHGHIRPMLPETIHPSLRSMLLTACYFQSNWGKPFDPAKSHLDYFYLENEAKDVVQTMCMKQTHPFRYTNHASCRVIELPHAFENFCVLIFLPHHDLSCLEREFTPAFFKEIYDALQVHRVTVQLPIFQMECTLDVLDTFQAMGMDFTDMSRMTSDPHMRVDAIIQKTRVKMDDERGSQDPSATAMPMDTDPQSDVVVFNACHPFFYLLMERVSHVCLLMGCLRNPTQATRE